MWSHYLERKCKDKEGRVFLEENLEKLHTHTQPGRNTQNICSRNRKVWNMKIKPSVSQERKLQGGRASWVAFSV